MLRAIQFIYCLPYAAPAIRSQDQFPIAKYFIRRRFFFFWIFRMNRYAHDVSELTDKHTRSARVRREQAKMKGIYI